MFRPFQEADEELYYIYKRLDRNENLFQQSFDEFKKSFQDLKSRTKTLNFNKIKKKTFASNR